MLAFIKFSTVILFLFAEAGHSAGGGGGFMETYNRYFNYPGFEAWKFLNLAIFVGILIYLLKTPLSQAFKNKREDIRRELVRAKEEKEAALKQLEATESRLAALNSEKAEIMEQSKREAEMEVARIAEQTEADVSKLRTNAQREIEAVSSVAKRELRKFSAEESIRLAEEILRRDLKADKASELVNASISGLGGAK
jgi:F0F1-type ATP synthase membrane subunit b/b'